MWLSPQVHEEFKQNVENIGIENLIKKFAEQKGTGTERPGTIYNAAMYKHNTGMKQKHPLPHTNRRATRYTTVTVERPGTPH